MIFIADSLYGFGWISWGISRAAFPFCFHSNYDYGRLYSKSDQG